MDSRQFFLVKENHCLIEIPMNSQWFKNPHKSWRFKSEWKHLHIIKRNLKWLKLVFGNHFLRNSSKRTEMTLNIKIFLILKRWTSNQKGRGRFLYIRGGSNKNGPGAQEWNDLVYFTQNLHIYAGTCPTVSPIDEYLAHRSPLP